MPLGRRDFPVWPLASEAKAELEILALGQEVHLQVDNNAQDRYRRVLAHLVRSDGLWLQGAMIERGFARVYTFSDNRRLANALLQKEQLARAGQSGIWALSHYAVRPVDPASLQKDYGTFQVV